MKYSFKEDSDCVFSLVLLPPVWQVATFCGRLFTIAVRFSPLYMAAKTSKPKEGINRVI